jgi:hypothetical protein
LVEAHRGTFCGEDGTITTNLFLALGTTVAAGLAHRTPGSPISSPESASAWPVLCVWNPSQDKYGDDFRYTTEELHNIANLYATSNEAAALHPAHGSREVNPSSGNEAPSDAVIHSTKDSAKGGKKVHKQHL